MTLGEVRALRAADRLRHASAAGVLDDHGRADRLAVARGADQAQGQPVTRGRAVAVQFDAHRVAVGGCAAGHGQVAQAVAVHVEPARARVEGGRFPRAQAAGAGELAALRLQEESPGHAVQIEQAVVVEVDPVGREHLRPDPEGLRIDARPVSALVDEQDGPSQGGDQDVDVSVAVEVGRDRTPAVAIGFGLLVAQTGRGGEDAGHEAPRIVLEQEDRGLARHEDVRIPVELCVEDREQPVLDVAPAALAGGLAEAAVRLAQPELVGGVLGGDQEVEPPVDVDVDPGHLAVATAGLEQLARERGLLEALAVPEHQLVREGQRELGHLALQAAAPDEEVAAAVSVGVAPGVAVAVAQGDAEGVPRRPGAQGSDAHALQGHHVVESDRRGERQVGHVQTQLRGTARAAALEAEALVHEVGRRDLDVDELFDLEAVPAHDPRLGVELDLSLGRGLSVDAQDELALLVADRQTGSVGGRLEAGLDAGLVGAPRVDGGAAAPPGSSDPRPTREEARTRAMGLRMGERG